MTKRINNCEYEKVYYCQKADIIVSPEMLFAAKLRCEEGMIDTKTNKKHPLHCNDRKCSFEIRFIKKSNLIRRLL